MNVYGDYTAKQVVDHLMSQPGQNDTDALLDAVIVLAKIVVKQQAQIDELKAAMK